MSRATGTSRTTATAQRDGGPSLRLTSQITTDETGTENEQISSGYTAGGYTPGEANAGITCGCAFGGPGAYGYNPDFGYAPGGGGMSVWPGVPACCDPWFGYCGEPRCFTTCNCKQGTYQYFHCASRRLFARVAEMEQRRSVLQALRDVLRSEGMQHRGKLCEMPVCLVRSGGLCIRRRLLHARCRDNQRHGCEADACGQV